ncbi:MAG: glycosyltransferase family 4 protein [Desulfurococcales archaeon]|nr:glycosyltransferase family 4 protein [Desulfurococcales archaeon]
MSILYITNILSDEAGGGEYLFWLYSKYMAMRGHRVHVIARIIEKAPHEGVVALETGPDITQRGVQHQGILGNLAYIKRGLEKVKAMYRDIDIIHSNTYMPAIIGGLSKVLYRKPHVITIHDIAAVMGVRFIYKWFREGGSSGLGAYAKALVSIAYEHILAKHIPRDLILAPSHQTKRDVEVLGGNGVEVVPNFIDTEYYNKLKSLYGVDYEPCILYIGRLVFYKNILYMLKLFKNLKDIKLVIIGGGPEYNMLRKLIPDNMKGNIEVLGNISQERKALYLSKCAATINLSYFEGFGLTILESWLFEKPVIAASIPPFTEIVENNIDGLLVDIRDKNGVLKAVETLARNRGYARKLGLNGYRKLAERYTPDIITSMLESVYARVIKGI